MSFIHFAILLQSLAAFLVAANFLVFHRIEKEADLRFFAWGYIGFGLSGAILFQLCITPDHPPFQMIFYLPAMFGACTLHKGALQLHDRPAGPFRCAGILAAAVWDITAFFLDVSFEVRHLPASLLITLLLLDTSRIFRISFRTVSRSSWTISILTSLWALLLGGFPFYGDLRFAGAVGFSLSAFFEMAIAVCVVYLYHKRARIRLTENENRYHRLIDAASDAVLLIKEGIIIECNRAAAGIFNSDVSRLTGRPLADLSPGNAKDRKSAPSTEDLSGQEETLAMEDHFLMAASEARFFDWRFQRDDGNSDDGNSFDAEVSLSPVILGKEPHVLAIVRDISEKKKAKDFFNTSAAIFNRSIEGLLLTDPAGRILFVNPAFERITGYTEKEALGQNPRMLKSNYHDADFYQDMWKTIRSGKEWSAEIRNRRKSGEVFTARLTIAPIMNDRGKILRFMSLMHDISDLKRSQEEASFHANYDGLTSLPNRTVFLESMGVRLQQAEKGDIYAVLTIDIKNFSLINDNYGHLYGDKFLQAFTRRLKDNLDHGLLISRLGGDQFIIFLERLQRQEQIVSRIHRILDLTHRSFRVDGRELYVFINIGACFSDTEPDPDVMVKNADLALKNAKQRGSNTYEIFQPQMTRRIEQRIHIETDLRRAIESIGYTDSDGFRPNREIQTWFQPKVELKPFRVSGMEALVRWRKPDGEMVPPGMFISIAEETGLIIDIADIVLQDSLEMIKRLDPNEHTDFRVAINASSVQFEGTDMPAHLARRLSEAGVPPRRLEVELTESALISDTGQVIRRLKELRKTGISIALDDFGTGFSSLSYLRHLPLDVLKIDKSFIDDIDKDERALAMTSHIIRLAGLLGMKTVAEGVESREQLRLLHSTDCDVIQGYIFSKPLPPDEMAAFYAAGPPAPSPPDEPAP